MRRAVNNLQPATDSFGRRAGWQFGRTVLVAPCWIMVVLKVATMPAAAGPDTSSPTPATRPVDFDTEVKPIFEQNCVRCHGPTRAKGGFRLDNYSAFLKGGDSGVIIIPGDSTNSVLIQLVAQLDPDSVMPPEGEGDPLTPAQVALLRKWIDQGAWWGKSDEDAEVKIAIAPAAGFISVTGNAAQFREHAWVQDGWRAGVESFEISQQATPDTRFTLSGHAMTDDYLAKLLVEKQNLGFASFGFEQFRKYYSDTGGYYPAFTPSVFSLDQDLHLDIGRAWFDFGLTLPDWPRLVVGYEYQYRNGTKSTLQWGMVGTSPFFLDARNIYPAYKTIDERVQILKFDVDYAAGGWLLEDNFRGEWTDLGTSQHDVFTYDPSTPSSLQQTTVQQGWRSFEGANTLRVERQFRDWLFASAGYLYSKLNGDAEFSLDLVDSTGTPLLQDTVQSIVLERESHVGNANVLLGPWQGGTLAIGVQGELTKQNGTLENATQNFPLGDPTIASAITEINRAVVDESVLLRITRVPFTTLFAEARMQQDSIGYDENVETGALATTFLRDTDSQSDVFDIRAGFDTSPSTWWKFGWQYRWRDRSTTYDDGYADDDPADPGAGGYPTLISALDQTTQELESRLTLRPRGWFKTTFTHRWVVTDYKTTTEPATDNIAGDASPGGQVMAGKYDAQIFSVSFTLTPWRRMQLLTTLSYQDVSCITLQNYSPAVVPYRGDTWSVYCHGRYALTQKTDLMAGWTYSNSDFQQNNFADGLPLGVKYGLNGLQVGLASRCTKNLTTKLQYGYYNYTEPSSGGANDYTAHAVFVSLNWRLN